ncbi:MAG: glutamate racemase [Bacteroidales bacterium]|nr:glutamate racemase [Candidatus Cryptobacteroides aphodequi]
MITIGVLDSGVGGLSVLREILKVLPDCQFIYYADSANCPYGGRRREWITGRVREVVHELIGRGAQAIVLACNTATGAAIETLRTEMPDIPFIGMEPAVKPAAIASKTGVIGVLATKSTLGASKYIGTRERYAGNVKVLESVGEGFVELVEKGLLTGEEAERTVRRAIAPLLEGGADNIVLGCTHYPFLLETLQKVAGPAVNFIDPAPAVARRLVSVLREKGLIEAQKKQRHNVTLLCSGSDETLKALYDSLF